MAHLKRSTNAILMMLSSFSATNCKAPWGSRSILQHRKNWNNFPFFNSWRNYCSTLELKLPWGLSTDTRKSYLAANLDQVARSDDAVVTGGRGCVEGHDLPLSIQSDKVDLEKNQAEAEDLLWETNMEDNQELNKILCEAQAHVQGPQTDFNDEIHTMHPKVWSELEENTRRLVEEEAVLLYEDYLTDLQYEPPKAQPQSGDLAFAAKLLRRRRKQWNVIEEMHRIENEKIQKKIEKIERFETSKKKRRAQYQAEFGLAQGESHMALLARQKSSKKDTPALNKYGTDMNDLVRDKKHDPVAGRQSEIKRLIMILGRRRKNNPCLIGEPGVGKTAIIEELAYRIEQRDVPHFLLGKRVISVDMGLVLAGCRYVGMFEERMTHIIREAKECKDVILFFDEIHMLLGAGSHSTNETDAADHLKPPLARGELRCIGATTIEEYRKHIMKDAALERRFQPVKVVEPSVEDTIEILKGLQKIYEDHHSVTFTDTAIVSAAKLSHHYIRGRFLPDKAIDLIDEAASCVQLRYKEGKIIAAGDPQVTEDDIQEALSCWIGIPKENVSVDESERLLRLEEILHATVVGQDKAVTAVSDAIRRARAGIRNPQRPVASLIFSGPTGVGKTELAKALAVSYYGSEDAMVRLDMSEFMDQSSVTKLIGAPPGSPGYGDGGQLTEAVRRCPHSIVLFDEIEKAHSTVFDIMLQIMDAGRLTDGQGRTVDFKNTMLIITSNIGSQVIRGQCSEADDEENEYTQSWVQSLVMEELQKVFRPEFLDRVDETIFFRKLKLAEVSKIADMMLKDVSERMIEKKKIVAMKVTDRFKEKVLKEGYDPKYGARSLRRAIMRLLENNLANKILAGEIEEGDVVEVDVGVTGNVVIHAIPKL